MDEKDFITVAVHNEFARRIDDENHRQNRRIETLENTIQQISELTASVKELAVNMKNMLTEQEKQGNRLKTLESRDGDKWRAAISHVVTAIIGAVICYIFTSIGM